jgi:signal transduction histidine kinase
MSSRSLRSIYKTFGFRLTVSFSLAFILSSLALFGFAYLLVSSSLRANDRTAVQLKLKEYIQEYHADSVAGIKREIEIESASGALRNFMIRLADPKNRTLALKAPEEATYDLKRLDTSTDGVEWTQLKAVGEDDVLDISSIRLEDGNLLQVGKGPEDREDILDRFRNTFVEMLVGTVLLSLVGGTLVARQALRPVRSLVNVLGPIIDTRKVKARVPVRGTGDEFDDLSLRFNQALEKIDALVEGIRASMDNVAHDLRTPMTRLRGTAEMALQSEPNLESYREALSDCLEESEQVLRMLNMLMDISEVESGSVRLNIGEVKVLDLMNQVCELYRSVAEDRNTELLIDCPCELSVSGDRNRLMQVMANLLDNAIKYTPAGGCVQFSASSHDERVLINIRDSGVGIPPEDLSKIWDRSFRGDKSRTQHGLGLGLSLVRAVVQAHKGTIDVFSDRGKGTQFSIQLPAQPTRA